MNASAFSCGVRPDAAQLPGYVPPVGDDESPDTCMSENTTLPQRSGSWTSFGVVNWIICGPVKPSGLFAASTRTHSSAFVVSTATHVLRPVPFWIGITSLL